MLKKILTVGVIFIMCLGILSGCGDKGNAVGGGNGNGNSGNGQIGGNEGVLEVPNETIVLQAKQSYLESVVKPKNPEATISDISLRPFLGVYGDSLVAVFYAGKYHGDFADVLIEYMLSTIEFSFSDGYPILVFSGGNIYDLRVAYAQGLLTTEDLVKIYNERNEYGGK